jgi:hypothetical protein
MQIESKQLYKQVAEKHNVDLELIQNLGNMAFQEMNKLTKNPPNLILGIRGLGIRFVRKKKSINVLRNLKLDLIDPNNKRDKEEVQKDIEIIEGLLARYEVFLNKKKEYKLLRNAFKPPLESNIQQEEIQTTSQDNLS